ncbi:microtubule-actin cross-linking factor 1-like [Tachyglossus aculeatus]|uniref:microtubule-actin cross-linking factor 1-like n=1 Tax=Tachyglossus aculeatus TaxID=9261 RepID=UPI0018F3D356|nr:microtubule-actin cross-linking factor 1-like [Tachyglossus aculeatus]
MPLSANRSSLEGPSPPHRSPPPPSDRYWTQRQWRAWGLEIRTQILALRHWLDGLERQLPRTSGEDLQGPQARAWGQPATIMGNLAPRPSCLGEKGHHSEEFPRGCRGGGGPEPELSPPSPALPDPLPPARLGSPVLPDKPWGWQARSTREVTEVTEVTETVVTEIVEVTRYPGSGRPTVTRTVTVLTESAAELPRAPSQVVLPAAEFSEPPETLASLQAWLADVEELLAGQRPLAAEVKVAIAQLQEQKLLKRLLEEWRPRVERLLQDRWTLPPSQPDGEGDSGTLACLQGKWELLVQLAETRQGRLEQIVPAAQDFQADQEGFLAWLVPTERLLAKLWWEDRGAGRLQEALKQVQGLREEIRAKAAELERVMGSGQKVLELVAGEEAQSVQEQLEALRVRLLLAGQSGADVQLRLRQAVEAAAQLQPGPEQPGAWLDRLEQALRAAEPAEAEDVKQWQEAVRAELEHLAKLGQQLEALSRVTLEPEALRAQLAQHKLLAAEILQHRELEDRLLHLMDVGLPGLCPLDEQQQLQPELTALRARAEEVRQESAAGVLRREQALSLLAQFAEARGELEPWLEQAQGPISQLDPNGVDSPEACKEQQELLQSLREAIAEHRPLVGKLQRVAGQLKELSPTEGGPFQEAWRAAEESLGTIRAHVSRVAAALEETVPRYSQLCERLSRLAEQLEQLSHRVRAAGTVRAEAGRIREQLREQVQLLGDLEPLGAALEAAQVRAQELGVGTASGKPGAASQALQAQVEQLRGRWLDVRAEAREQEQRLRGLLVLAEQFWQGLAELAGSLGGTQHLVLHLEEAGPEPEGLRSRLSAMQALREEVDTLQTDLDALGALGLELLSACGDVDRPEVTRSLDELYASWHNLSRVWTERNGRLEEQLQEALGYQETMQRLLDWLEGAELRMGEEFLVGGDLEMVKQQLDELKAFKQELYQSRVEVESLRHRPAVGDPEKPSPPPLLGSFRQRWDCLEEEAVSRQHQLEATLLGLGQLQPQLDELVQWLEHTADQLQGAPSLGLDLQGCEIELAKHRVLRNDVLSRARTVQSVSEAARGLLATGLGEAEAGLQLALQTLQRRWESVRSETESRQLQLENNLGQLQDVELEASELLDWLEQVDVRLFLFKPSWGPPDTPQERLALHTELCRELEQKRAAYEGLRERLQRLVPAGPRPLPRPVGTEHSLWLLEHTWQRVAAQAGERKVWLSEGLALSTEFHQRAQELLRWGVEAEERFGSLAPPSLVLDTVSAQLQEHKVLAQEVASQGEKLAGLESVAGRLKGFSQEQDCTMIQSLVFTAQEWLGRARHRVGERGTALEEARRRAKQFTESRRLLLDWLDEVEPTLELPRDSALSQGEIKVQLSQHKEFQRELRGKRPVFEATLRGGRALREGALLPEDAGPLDLLLAELRGRWDGVCSRALERQQALEEVLLFSGRFADALPALMDWLYQAEPQLAEEGPVAGDRDLVNRLVDEHKVFQKELGRRAGCVRLLRRSVRELTRGGGGGGGGSSADSQWLQRQVEELGQRWELVCRLSLARQARLEGALQQAEEFDGLVHSFLERLTDVEKTLRLGPLPEEEGAVRDCQNQLQEMLRNLQCQQLELECVTSLGEEILNDCHPDAVITVRSWVSVATSRFQEVLSWAQKQGQRAQERLEVLEAQRAELTRLLDWITAAEEALTLRDLERLPEDMEQLDQLRTQHTEFTEELNQKQPEVELAMRSCNRRSSLEGSLAPQRPPAGRRGAGKTGSAPRMPLLDLEPQSPLAAQLLGRWQQLWLIALDRQYRLQAAAQRLEEQEAFAHFDFGVWRRRYLQWIGHRKSRLLDIFRSIDRDQDGRVSHQEFINSVMASKFPTSLLEMSAVASVFDTNGDGFIDYCEFVSALHPSRDPRGRGPDADRIQDEVTRQVSQCNCARRFLVEQISANRYRFGESQQLRMVRILRSSLMVRVGGGWIALDEFLVKNDPCRVKGRTNLKINEKYLSSERSACSAKALSPSRSASSLSLYSSASAPSSPLSRKPQLVRRRPRSGDRGPHSRSSLPLSSTDARISAADPRGDRGAAGAGSARGRKESARAPEEMEESTRGMEGKGEVVPGTQGARGPGQVTEGTGEMMQGTEETGRVMDRMEEKGRAAERTEETGWAAERTEETGWATERMEEMGQAMESMEETGWVTECTEEKGRVTEGTETSAQGTEEVVWVMEGAEEGAQGTEETARGTERTEEASRGTEEMARATEGTEETPKVTEEMAQGPERPVQVLEGKDHTVQGTQGKMEAAQVTEGTARMTEGGGETARPAQGTGEVAEAEGPGPGEEAAPDEARGVAEAQGAVQVETRGPAGGEDGTAGGSTS